MRFRFQLYSSVITVATMLNERGDLCEIIELPGKGWEVKVNGRQSKKAPPRDGYVFDVPSMSILAAKSGSR